LSGTSGAISAPGADTAGGPFAPAATDRAIALATRGSPANDAKCDDPKSLVRLAGVTYSGQAWTAAMMFG
jgi:hypothetical protein